MIPKLPDIYSSQSGDGPPSVSGSLAKCQDPDEDEVW